MVQRHVWDLEPFGFLLERTFPFVADQQSVHDAIQEALKGATVPPPPSGAFVFGRDDALPDATTGSDSDSESEGEPGALGGGGRTATSSPGPGSGLGSSRPARLQDTGRGVSASMLRLGFSP